MDWELKEITDYRDCIMDQSGLYTIINRHQKGLVHKGYTGSLYRVRVDIMSSDDLPIMSFESSAMEVENLRKAVIDFIQTYPKNKPSLEHASYIGAEISRAGNDLDRPYNQK